LAGSGLDSAQKKAKREGYTIVFADESGFRLLPMRVRTWALRGQTPRLRVPLSHKHLSVMGGITLDGRLLTWQLDHACRGEDCVYFLRHLLRQIAGKVLVIWDGLPAHRSQLVKDFLRAEAAGRLWLVALPAYAPDLNPIEAIWNYLKRFELANLCTRSLDELRPHLRRAIERLRHRKNIILSCFQHQFNYL
jgi:transposase